MLTIEIATFGFAKRGKVPYMNLDFFEEFFYLFLPRVFSIEKTLKKLPKTRAECTFDFVKTVFNDCF